MSPAAPRPLTSWVRMIFAIAQSTLPLSSSRGVGQQRHLTAVLHGRGDVTLVLGAVAGDPAGTDLAAVGDELPQQVRVLVVDVGDLLLAEHANLLLRLASRRLRH